VRIPKSIGSIDTSITSEDIGKLWSISKDICMIFAFIGQHLVGIKKT